MVSDGNIAQLIEMGFTQEQAQEALTKSNNDVEQALAYLFNDAPEPNSQNIEPLTGPTFQPPESSRDPYAGNVRAHVNPTDSSVSDYANPSRNDKAALNGSEGSTPKVGQQSLEVSHDSTVNVEEGITLNPPILPERPGNAHSTSYSKNIGGFLDDDLRETLSSYVDHDLTPSSDVDRFSEYNIYADESKHLRRDYLPPILLPGSRSALEAYLAPLLMILHEVTTFRNVIFEHSFEDYGFIRDWFKGENIPLASDVSSRFVLETQRVFAFLDGDSERFFASVKGVAEAFPDALSEDFEKVETVDELISCIYNAYIHELKKTNDLLANDVDTLFHCKFNTSEHLEVNAACFPIEFDHIRSNMYQSLHNIIIGENMERENAIDISQFSDVITIPILSPENMFNVSSGHGLSVPEVFYPQIYSKSHNQVYRNAVSKLSRLVTTRQEAADARQSLTSFRGAKIVEAAQASLEALNLEVDELSIRIDVGESNETEKLSQLTAAAKDMEQFCISFQAKVNGLRKQWIDVSKDIDSFDLTKEINEKMAEVESPYTLAGAIFDESNFYYLTKDRDASSYDDNQWIRVAYQGNNFHLAKYSFERVAERISAVTSNPSEFSTPIILIYCKADHWNQVEGKIQVPVALQKFLAEDRAYVRNLFNEATDLSPTSVSNEEEDDFDEYIENADSGEQQSTHKLGNDDDEDLVDMGSNEKLKSNSKSVEDLIDIE